MQNVNLHDLWTESGVYTNNSTPSMLDSNLRLSCSRAQALGKKTGLMFEERLTANGYKEDQVIILSIESKLPFSDRVGQIERISLKL